MKLIFVNLRAAGLVLCCALACGAVVRAQQPADSKTGEGLTVEQALARYEQALEATADPARKFYLLTDAAPTALSAGRPEKAKSYARALLDQAPSMAENWNYGNAVHVGNTVLGLIALRDGGVAEAGRLLLASAGSRGSPQLNSFGPDMGLAKELLARGERDTVAQYLELCGKFWKGDFGKLGNWRAAVARGETPDFRPNVGLLNRWRFKQWDKLKH